MNNRQKIENIIKNSLTNNEIFRKEYYLFGKIFYIQEPFIGDINVKNVISKIEDNFPPHLFEEIDVIFVGTFEFLNQRDLEAMYKDGAIYISNSILSDKDLIENILHETAHSLELPMGSYIYGDGRLNFEFLGKRKRLRDLLDVEDITQYENFLDTEYNLEFDKFLYQTIGYPKLKSFTNGLFHTPYAVTSLREYWASGFEDYFLGNSEILKNISPELFNKIEGVITYES